MKQVGILGGTFDPIHNGHIQLAKHAKQQFNLDEIWLMPSPNPPHKADKHVTDYSYRCDMVKLAIQGMDGYICSEYEESRTGLSYTSETLTSLHKDYPDIHFYFIMGADSFFELPTWHDPETIMKYATIIVASRDYKRSSQTIMEFADHLRRHYHADIDIIDAQEIDISSERLRNNTSSGRSIRKYVAEAVADYIESHKLYLEGDTNHD